MKLTKEDYSDLVELYTSAFPIHNIFQKSREDIISYLKKNKDGFIIARDDDSIIGALLLKDGKLKHLAVSEDLQGQGIGKELVGIAEGIVKRGMIEVKTVDRVDFFIGLGYKLVEERIGYYREGEKVYFLSKELG